MKALILAAGQGTRLMPLTADRPKCLVTFMGVSMLQRIFDALDQVGVRDVVVVGGYRAERIEELGVKVVRNERFATTNMVSTLFAAEAEFPADDDLLISYGDIIYEPAVLKALAACDAPVALAVNTDWRQLWERRFDDPLTDAETLKIDEGGLLKELGRKPKGYDEIQAQYMGLIKVRRDRVADLKRHYAAMDRAGRFDGKDFDNMYMTSFIQSLVDAGWPVQTVPVHGGWLEIDSAEDRDIYEGWAKSGELSGVIRL